MTQVRHFLDLWRLEASDLRAILDDAKARKAARLGWPKGRPDADRPADGRTLALRDVTLAGDRLRFTVNLPEGPRTFSGSVRDDVIEAEPGGNWRAQRLS